MSLKEKFKSMWSKVCKKSNGDKTEKGKHNADDCDCGCTVNKNPSDAEISAEEVVREEIFPAGKRKTRAKTTPDPVVRKTTSCAAKKRSRPTNSNYRMIDPDDNSCDTSKS